MNFSLYLTAKDTRSPRDIADYMLQRIQDALSPSGLGGLITGVAAPLANEVQVARNTLDSTPASSINNTNTFIGIVDGNPGAFDNGPRNVSGELVGRALSARYMIQKFGAIGS